MHSVQEDTFIRLNMKRDFTSEVVRRYLAGASTVVIAAHFGCSPQRVSAALVRAGVARRFPGPPGWPVGTRHEDVRGYVRVKTERGWVFEHRAMMAKKLGRQLRVDEHVHHDDEVRSNNEDSNLKVLSRKEHGREHHGYSGDEIAQMRRLYTDGVPVAHIRALTGASIWTLYKYVRDLPRRGNYGVSTYEGT